MANNLAIPIPSTCTHKGIHTQGGGNLSTWREPQSQHVIMLYPERNIKLHIKLQHSCHCCGDWCFCPGGIVSVFCCLLSCNLFFWETLITCSPAFSEFSSIFWNIKYLCYILAPFICHSVFLIIETPRTLWVVDTFHSKHLTTISTSIWSTKNVHGYMHIWLHLLSYWGTESVLL